MKRFILCLAALLTLTLLPNGCGAVVTVEGEDDAVKVYTYPAKNLLGLEKIAVFEDHVIAVFAADSSASDEAATDDREVKTYLLAEDVSYALPTTSSLKTERGRRILRVDLDRSNPTTKIPEHPVFSGLHFDGAAVEFSDECTTVKYTVWGGECSQTYSQTYDAGRGKWRKAEEEFTLYEFGPAH